MARQLIVVSGLPASGKTTFARRLSADLDVPLLAKDDIKELLFEKIPQKDREWSTVQGRAAIAMMYAGARELLCADSTVIIESSFDSRYALSDIEELRQLVDAQLIEVHCSLEYAERQRRWSARSATTRHPGHLDDPAHVLSRSRRSDDVPLYPDTAYVIDTGVENSVYEREYEEIMLSISKKLKDQ